MKKIVVTVHAAQIEDIGKRLYSILIGNVIVEAYVAKHPNMKSLDSMVLILRAAGYEDVEIKYEGDMS